MIGVKFGDKHSYDDFGLYLSSRVYVSPPAVKKHTLSIEGANGNIDLSDLLTGDVFYENRTITCNFIVVGDRDTWSEKYSALLNYLHGQPMRIILDDDPKFFYYGRVSVNKWQSSKVTATIAIDCDVEAYKYDINSSTDEWEWDTFDFDNDFINECADIPISGSTEVVVIGRRMRVVPTIVSDADMTVTYSGITYNIAAGENKVYDIAIVEGVNTLIFDGTGTISIEFRGGEL